MIFNRTEDWKHLIESLHGVLKTYLPWLHFALHGSFAHELPNQVVRNHDLKGTQDLFGLFVHTHLGGKPVGRNGLRSPTPFVDRSTHKFKL